MSGGFIWGGIFILCFGIGLIYISVIGSGQIPNGNLSQVSDEPVNILTTPFFYVGILATISGIVSILLGIFGNDKNFGGLKRGKW